MAAPSLPVDLVIVAEDVLSLTVLVRILQFTGRPHRILQEINARGCGNMRRDLARYRNASHVIRHVLLVDLDQAGCAPLLRREWGLASVPDRLQFRVAVRETEAWLLADRQSFAAFAGIDAKKVPAQPEALDNPKQTLVNAVRASRNRRLAAELVPPRGSVVPIGPLYNERLVDFVRTSWNIEAACAAAPSLRRTVDRLQRFLAVG